MTNYTEILGFFSAFCTTMAFFPQARKTWKSRSAKDISLMTFVLFVVGVSGWLIYGLLLMKWPIILANTFTLILASSILYFKLKFD